MASRFFRAVAGRERGLVRWDVTSAIPALIVIGVKVFAARYVAVNDENSSFRLQLDFIDVVTAQLHSSSRNFMYIIRANASECMHNLPEYFDRYVPPTQLKRANCSRAGGLVSFSGGRDK